MIHKLHWINTIKNVLQFIFWCQTAEKGNSMKMREIIREYIDELGGKTTRPA